MQLKIVTPLATLDPVETTNICMKTTLGWWTLLPRHADMVAILVPHVMTCLANGSSEKLFALDDGILVKKGPSVTAAVRHAFFGDNPGELERRIREEFFRIDEQEQRMRSIIAKLQADFLRFFSRMGRRP